jgi:amicoumacin kinase
LAILLEREVELLFKDEVIQQAIHLFNLDYSSLKKLGSFENYVFSGKRAGDGQDFILRFTHSSHRSKQQVEAELAWLQYLQHNGAPVCGPFKSLNGDLVEAIEIEGTFFFSSLFEKAKGIEVKVNEPSFDETLFYAWGSAIGILHRLTSEYVEEESIIKRPDAIEEFQVQFGAFIPKEEIVQKKVDKVLTSISKLPKDKDQYLLIHSDIHSGNFFFDGTKITIFDFDDCSYHHIIADIAIPIYYSVWFNNRISDKDEFINRKFLPAFMKGYLNQQPINLQLLRDIPLFLKLRDCELYGVLHKKWDLTSLNEKQTSLLAEIRERIVSETPIVSLQFDEFM